MSGRTGIEGSRTVGLVVVALLVLGLSPLLKPHAQPAEGPLVPIENRSMRFALDAQGGPWAVWEVDDGSDTDIYYSRWTDSQWQQPRPVSADPEAWEYSPSLALAADGTLWAAWSQSAAADQSSIWVSHWQGEGWSSPSQVPGTAALASTQPALAPTPAGGLWLALVGHDGTDREIFVSRWDGTAWSAPERVGNDDTDPLAYDLQPTLVVDSEGLAWLAWTSYEGLLNDEIHASHWDGAAWSPQHQVSSPDDTPDAWPALALGADGQPWIAWHGVAGEDGGRWRIYASQWEVSDATWRGEALVSSPPTLNVQEQHPSLALDADGQLHLTWAISGGISGIAHTTRDGDTWAFPTWTSTDTAVEIPAILADGEPLLLWLAEDGPDVAPVQQEQVQEMTEPVPEVWSPTPEAIRPLSSAIPNLHLAHGDSITSGDYLDVSGLPSVPYPTALEELLDNNAVDSEVINWGNPGEKARAAESRIRLGVQTHTPQFVEIMEGTNDISSNYSPAETAFAVRMLVWTARDRSGVTGVKVIVGTLVPRRDNKNDLIYETNQIILKNARRDGVPVADLWTAFYDYGPWEQFYVDLLHPGTAGLRIIAETFYQTILDAGYIVADPTPPTAWFTSLPPYSECAAAQVAWTGDDGDGSGVASFDVQVQDNWGPWINWLVETPDSSGTYENALYGHTLRFQVRARDKVGNVGAYSPPAETQIVDTIPPESVDVAPLPGVQKVPFTLHWSGTDQCDPKLTYDVEYCVGEDCGPTTGTWTSLETSTTSTSVVFDPPAPQYGARYHFRARAHDDAGNRKDSALVSTRLAQFTLGGDVVNVRDEPVAAAKVTVTGALAVDQFLGGGYLAYVAESRTYELSASRQGFGSLPPMHAKPVTGDLSGLDFVLPPLDDIVRNGGFESGGGLGRWQPGGTPSPEPITEALEAHTGSGAVRLGGGAGTSSLSQSLTVPATLTNPTLSFLVRLDEETSGSSSLRVKLDGTPLSWEEPVSPGGWIHIWHRVDAAVGKAVTLTFAVSGNPAVRLDEVSLGSSMPGGGWTFIPSVSRAGTP